MGQGSGGALVDAWVRWCVRENVGRIVGASVGGCVGGEESGDWRMVEGVGMEDRLSVG